LVAHQPSDFTNVVLRIPLEKGSIQRNQGPPLFFWLRFGQHVEGFEFPPIKTRALLLSNCKLLGACAINAPMKMFLGLILFVCTLSNYSYADVVNGLYAKAYGDHKNQALIFLHGGPGYNSYSFEFSNAELLSKRGYYVIVFDQRGCGRSEKARLDTYTFPNAVKDVHDIIANYKISSPVLLGHSYGGTLAVRYAETYPSEVKSVLLIDAPMDQQGMVKNILDRCEAVYAQRSDQDDVKYIQQIRSAIFGTGKYVMNRELGGYIFYHASKCGLYSPKQSNVTRDNLWKQLRVGPRADLLTNSAVDPFAGLIQNEGWMTKNTLPELASLPMPTFGIFGQDDGLFSAAQLDVIGKNLASGHFLSLPNASHNLFLDQQESFLEFVDVAVGK
jgi:proline iminopeptidase